MATETLTCPYCNASIRMRPSMAAGRRIVCPRCGDTFVGPPAASGLEETGITANAPAVSPQTPLAEPWQSRRSNRIVAGVVLGVMFVMAGGGLAFMLYTQSERRAHDTSRPPRRPGRQPGVPEPDVPSVATVAPDKLAALGYLPADINFLVGARITELLDSPTGVQMFRDPIKIGGSEYRLANLPAWVGLRLEDLDHFLFAAKLDDALLPPFYLVIRTVQPYDDEQIRQRLKAVRAGGSGKKKLYSFRMPQSDITFHVWFADKQTMVLALLPDHLESLPAQPIEDLQQFPNEVRILLKKRRESIAPVWIVGHSRNWTRTSAVKLLSRLKKEDLERLAALRTFGVWLVPEKSLSVKAVFECNDATAARRLGDYFHFLRGDDPSFKTALDGPWLTIQFHTGPDFLSRLMRR